MRTCRILIMSLLVLTTLACSILGKPNAEENTPVIESPPTVEVITTEPSQPTPKATQEPPVGSREQWAVGVAASSEYSNPNWSAAQATGPADTPECGDHDTAWASADQSSPEEWLELQYADPVIPQEIHIYETFNPGSIVKVEVVSTVSEYITVWEGPPGAVEICPRVFVVKVRDVDAPVSGVRITLDQSVINDWNEIDAVKLIGQPVQ